MKTKTLVVCLSVVIISIFSLIVFKLSQFDTHQSKENAALLEFNPEETFKTAFGEGYNDGLMDNDPRWRPVFSQDRLDMLHEMIEEIKEEVSSASVEVEPHNVSFEEYEEFRELYGKKDDAKEKK